MKNKRFPLFILVLVSISLLTSCQAINPAEEAQAAPAKSVSEADTEFDYELAADQLAYRWIAMARAYEKMGMLNVKVDPDDAMAYRWTAMAKAYERMGMLNNKMNPGDIDAYRWLAMARAYERMGLLNDK